MDNGMSDVDKWRQRALRLEGLLDSWDVFPKPVAEMTSNEIMEVMYHRLTGRANMASMQEKLEETKKEDESV